MGSRHNNLKRVRALACITALIAATAAGVTRADGGGLPMAPEKLPVSDFAQFPLVDAPVLSPDGNRVAAEIRSKGMSLLGILDVRGKGKPPTFIPTGKFDILWCKWAGNDRLLIGFIGDIKSARVEGRISRLMLYDLPKNELHYLAMKAQGASGDNVIHIADDGSFILVSTARDPWSGPSVFRVDLDSGEWTDVVPPRRFVDTWIADNAGVVRLGAGVEYRKRRWIYRESAAEEFKPVGRLDMDVDEADFEGMSMPASGQGGFVLSDAGTRRLALYKFDVEKFELGELVYGHPEVDIDWVQFSKDGSTVEGIFYTDDRARVVWLDEHMKEVQKEIDDALQGRVNHVTDSSTDRSKFIVFTGTADDPGHYYYYDRDEGVMARLGTRYDALRDKALAPVKAVSYRNRDGLAIPSYLTLPVGRAPKKLPLVVMPHGGPFARDSWQFDPRVQFLANRGYVVLQPNFRGSTGYGRDYLEEGFGQFGTGIPDDISDGVRWLISEGIVDAKRVCIMGSSFGGYAAMWGAITTPELYRCAISFAGVTDIGDMLDYDENFLYPVSYKWFRARIEGKEKTDLDAISPYHHADRLTIPLLLVHGDEDRVVPFNQARKMVRALKKAKKPFEFLEIEGAPHGFRTEAQHLEFLTAVDDFLAKHNPAD